MQTRFMHRFRNSSGGVLGATLTRFLMSRVELFFGVALGELI